MKMPGSGSDCRLLICINISTNDTTADILKAPQVTESIENTETALNSQFKMLCRVLESPKPDWWPLPNNDKLTTAVTRLSQIEDLDEAQVDVTWNAPIKSLYSAIVRHVAESPPGLTGKGWALVDEETNNLRGVLATSKNSKLEEHKVR